MSMEGGDGGGRKLEAEEEITVLYGLGMSG
jgi:hypothetical protein